MFMTSPRQRSEKPQRLSLHTVLLRRRWRAAHGLARILVRRIDAREGLISHYLEADFPGRSATFSIHLSLALSCGLHAVLGTAAGAGLAHLTAGLDMFPALLCGALLVLLFGLTTGISSWRRTAVFPFHELYRQAPLPEAALVRRLIRAEWLFAGLARSAAWALPGGWATVTIALAVGRGAGALTALPAVTVCLGLHALGFLAGCLLGSARARIRAERPDHLSRLALTLAAFGAAALAGWAFVQLTYGLMLTSVWVAFPRAADVLDPTRWEALLVAVEADGGARLAGLTEVAAGALTHPRFAPALALLLAGALLSCVALLVLPRRLVATGRVSARRSPAVRAWVTALGAAVRQHPLTVVLLRRLHANDWIVGQTFWQRATLPIESGAYLGVAVALAQTAAHPGVVALVTTVASAFVLHNQAIETRTELAPISGVGADGAATVLLGQTPGRIGITRSVSARCALLRAQLIPAAVLTTVALLAITTRTGHAPQYAVPAVALVVVSLYLAPLVQWYMGPVLYLEAGHQRDEELGLDSAAESLQDALQGVPRQVLLVVPAFVALAGHLLGPYLPERAFLAVSGGVVALHVAAIPVLLLTSRTLRRRGRAGVAHV